MIDSIQYITQDHAELSHAELCKRACEAGVKWVQLRMKNATEEAFLEEALKCRTITLEHNAKLIINDNLKITKQVSADGIHVGLEDTPVSEVRSFLGDKAIIGGTANTFSDAIQHIEGGADYLGVGPFKHTTTKKKLSPILGLKGYEEFLQNLKLNNLNIPIVAVGGIEETDVSDLMSVGVNGIAVSGLITYSKYPEQLTQRLSAMINFKPQTSNFKPQT